MNISWFVFALIATGGWGFADLFYKKSSSADDRYSHLKIAVWVGLVMGVCAAALLPLAESSMRFGTFCTNMLKYLPASVGYIVSMVIGYAGLRYLELSIVSPVQNASGALSTAAMVIWFLSRGRISAISEAFSPMDLIGTVLIVIGVIALAIAEQRISAAETLRADKKYRMGALALLFPLLYCVFDTLGTAADGIILDEKTGLGLGEIDVIILYGLTFFAVGVAAWIFLWIRTGKPYLPFRRSEWPKMAAAGCEEFGQVFYVYAMAAKPMLAAPMIASYCIVSVLLSRVILKERLRPSQYLCVGTVIAGIVLLGISEGLASV